MIDPVVLRNERERVIANLAQRGCQLDDEKLHQWEEERKALQVKLQALQNRRNTLSKTIGYQKAKGENITDLLKEGEEIALLVASTEVSFNQLLEKQNDYLARLPNLLHESVPVGRDETANVEIRRWGTPLSFSSPKDHVALTQARGQIDFDLSAKMSGARFVVLKGEIATLHRALAQFMLAVHTKEHGYEEVYVPYLVDKQALYGTGQWPKFVEDLFSTQGERELFLIPTAEVSLTNLVQDKIIEEEVLPLKWVSHTPCFRSEAGSYGKDTRGMFRQHQFDKVELVQVVRPEDSYEALEALTRHAEVILQRLALPYRVMLLCSGDVGFSAAKTYDLEVWLPSQNRYREISSCSNTESFQARRLQARYRPGPGKKPELVHTLNGSGLAIGRTLIAILENYQDEEGNIHVPEVLYPYMETRVIQLGNNK